MADTDVFTVSELDGASVNKFVELEDSSLLVGSSSSTILDNCESGDVLGDLERDLGGPIALFGVSVDSLSSDRGSSYE